MKLSERATAGIGHNKPPERVCKCCGQELPSPRNRERLAAFFCMLKPAFAQWPESHPFQPLSEEHLRAWLTVEAGWHTTRELEIGGPSKQHAANALRYFIDAGDGYRFFSMTAKGIRERRPKSIAFRKCSEADFKRVIDTASEIIETVIGVPIDRMKREAVT